MHPKSYQNKKICRASLRKTRASESSSWLHPWPFFIWGHGGLFFPGWLCLSTWPHKDRQRWLSYVNTCWGIAPLTLHEIFPLLPNVSAGMRVRSVPFGNKLLPHKTHAVWCKSAPCLISEHHTWCLLQSVLKQRWLRFVLRCLNPFLSGRLHFTPPGKEVAGKFTRLDQILPRRCESIWFHVTVSSFSIYVSLTDIQLIVL